MTTDHAQSLRLGQRPPSPTPGVQLITVATLPDVAYRGQIVYALDIDEFRVYDGDAWQIPTASATGGLQTFVQATEPVADNTGDLWMKTTNYTLYVWDGTNWQVVQDVDAPNRDLFTYRLAAFIASADTDDSWIYYIGTDPTGNVDWTVANGHWWFKTDTNQLYKRTAGSWVENTDAPTKKIFQDAGYPQAVGFDQVVRTYWQAGFPWANGTPGHGQDIGDIWIDTDDSNALYGFNGLWVKLTDKPIVQNAIAAATAQAAADAAQASADDALPDGNPPSGSPDPTSFSGIGYFVLKWTPIINNDPVMYEVHVAATDGFTADSSSKVGETSSSQFVVKALPGPDPGPGEDDPRALEYDTTYYARIIAKDADGAAAQSNQTTCTVVQATGVDIAADTITGAQIVAGSITGELLSASVIVSGEIKTAETGQRVVLANTGLQAYKPDNSKMINLPTDGTDGMIDMEVIARGLTAVNGASLYGDSELNADATLSLQQGITAPSFTPQVGVTYDGYQVSTSTLSIAQKTGSLGTFDLVPSEIYCMEWKDAATDYFVLHQIRSNGTRAWFFRVSDGVPLGNGAGGAYFTDYVNWQYYSIVEIPSGTHAGVYRMGVWIPHGDVFYLTSPQGINRYSRQNGSVAPAIGTDGANIFTAEVISSSLRVRYFVPTGTGENLASPTSTTESGQGFSSTNGLCTILQSNFDIGSGRYAVAHRNTNFNVQMLSVSGGAFYPGGSGNNWASSNKDAESWESPTSNRRAMAWDSANSVFWTFGGDGFMYKHTSERWDPFVSSSNYWAKTTYYDSAGTTHETNAGPAKNYTAKRRAKNFFTPPALTLGGADDPDNYRLYMARGATAPANSSYHLQYTGTAATTWTTMATATATPPTTNNFPGATPAQIDNGTAGTLLIRADGDITGVDANFTTLAVSGTATKGGDAIAINGPYYYGYMASDLATSNDTNTLVTWTAESSSGITHSSGVFTVPRAGQYKIYCQAYWDVSSTTGGRLCQVYSGSTGGSPIITGGTTGNAGRGVGAVASKTVTLAASGQFRVLVAQNAGGSLAVKGGANLTYISIDFIR